MGEAEVQKSGSSPAMLGPHPRELWGEGCAFQRNHWKPTERKIRLISVQESCRRVGVRTIAWTRAQLRCNEHK
jgi:hypothetical protein